MARRFVVEVTDDEYRMLLAMAKHFRHSGEERLKNTTWKEVAEDALAIGIQQNWEYGGHDAREDA